MRLPIALALVAERVEIPILEILVAANSRKRLAALRSTTNATPVALIEAQRRARLI
jgi:hypothetical protein